MRKIGHINGICVVKFNIIDMYFRFLDNNARVFKDDKQKIRSLPETPATVPINSVSVDIKIYKIAFIIILGVLFIKLTRN